MSIRKYPSYLFRDPLLHPQYLTDDRTGTPIIITNTIDQNVEGDNLLHSYIVKLDEDTFMPMPEGLGDLGEAMWVDDKWSDLAPKMADEARKHGWCVVVFFEEDDPIRPRWKVFSVQQFVDWIKEQDEETGLLERKGVKFTWVDDLGNQWTDEEFLFDDPNVHLVKFREGNDNTFAFPDLTQAIMTLAFEFRQIKGQFTFDASKPSYQVYFYGDAINDTNATELDSKLKGVDSTTAIGIPMKLLDRVEVIKNENITIIEPAMDKQIQLFSGLTRLPVSFYLGERQTAGGMNSEADAIDSLKVMQKKEMLFKRFAPNITQIFLNVYGMKVEPEMEQPETLDSVEDEEDSKVKEDNNGQENKDSDSGKETE